MFQIIHDWLIGHESDEGISINSNWFNCYALPTAWLINVWCAVLLNVACWVGFAWWKMMYKCGIMFNVRKMMVVYVYRLIQHYRFVTYSFWVLIAWGARRCCETRSRRDGHEDLDSLDERWCINVVNCLMYLLMIMVVFFYRLI